MKNNVHRFDAEFKPKKVLLISDVHWDNPKCDRDMLKRHLDQAKELEADILLNGDTFCLMQGAYDPRKSKNDIRPEHNKANYLDAVVNDAIEWFSPYANLIKVVGYGNHETNILKRQETDVIDRFVFGLNSSQRSARSRKPPKCYNCGEPGHISADCPTKSAGPKCYNCGETGHISSACSQPAVAK